MFESSGKLKLSNLRNRQAFGNIIPTHTCTTSTQQVKSLEPKKNHTTIFGLYKFITHSQTRQDRLFLFFRTSLTGVVVWEK
jgi:hypothetical protein